MSKGKCCVTSDTRACIRACRRADARRVTERPLKASTVDTRLPCYIYPVYRSAGHVYNIRTS